ncbi:MAG: endo-1,4-beta-xylanase, partial [Chloroflexota bacterium]
MRSFISSSGVRLIIFLFLIIPAVLVVSHRKPGAGAAHAAQSTLLTGDPRFGLNGILPDYYAHVHGIKKFPWASTAVEEGAKLNRFSFDWQTVEPQPDTFDFSQPAAYVASDVAHGLSSIAILEHTPYWASSAVTKNPAAQVPSGLSLPWNNTQNTWGYFVYQSALHFKGQVAYWEVWNEPDLQNGASWAGSRADFYLLLKVAYQAIKAADPSAQVLIGSLNYNPTWLNDVFKADQADPDSAANQGFFDGLGLHSYGRSIGIYNMAVKAHQVLANFGYTGKVLIATELGVAVDDDPPVPATGLIATSAEASSYIIEAFAAALAGGVDRMLLYRASDVGESGYYGLLKYSGTARSTVVAYQLATQYFANVQSARLIQSNTVTRVMLDEGDQQVTVLWNNAPRPTTISFYEQSANGGTLLDATGTPSQAVRDANGYYTIPLPGATNNHGANSSDFIIGGGPLILVERGPFVPTQTPTPTNTASASMTPTFTTTPTAVNTVPTSTPSP